MGRINPFECFSITVLSLPSTLVVKVERGIREREDEMEMMGPSIFISKNHAGNFLCFSSSVLLSYRVMITSSYFQEVEQIWK